MIAKLTLDFTDDLGHTICKGAIVRWYKAEGDRVEFGDALFDMHVEEVLIPKAHMDIIRQGRKLEFQPTQIADLAARQLESPPAVAAAALDPEDVCPIQWAFFLRVSALDEGVLRRIYSRATQETGDLIAIFSSSPDESLHAKGGMTAGYDFRVATTEFEPDPSYVLGTQTKKKEVEKKWIGREKNGPNYIMFSGSDDRQRRIGIYAIGSCDLNMIFACKPLIQPILNGTCCLLYEGTVADARSDILLQTLKKLPDEWLEPLFGRMRIQRDYFQPKLFQKTFTVAGDEGPEEFSKHIVVLSTGADLTRTLYRHKKQGFLVDPGGGWLNEPLTNFLTDLSSVSWFRENFETVGKVTVDEFTANFGQVIQELKPIVGSRILVFNQLTVEPNSTTHTCQFLKNPQNVRRLELCIALSELSRKLDFSIIDTNRILQRVGIQTQLDWDHPHPKVNLLLAQEAFRIMQDLEVFK